MKLSTIARRCGLLACTATAIVVTAGCGGEKTDVSQGVKQINDTLLAPQGASLDCPKQVDGGEGAEFDCTLKGKGGKTADVKLKVTKQNGAFAVDVADQKGFTDALQTVIAE